MASDDSDKPKDESISLRDNQAREAPNSMPGCQSQPATSRVREYVAPRNEVETGVAEILAEFLTIERVGAEDNLILLGGESLLAAQAARRIWDRFGCDVTLRSILTGTVADIAAEIFSANRNSQA